MSNRAEEAAREAYPPNIVDLYGEPCDAQAGNRQKFIQGYEQAEKDTIERIIWYLGECDLEHTILDFDKYGYAYIDFEILEMLIHKAMEEE